jgi:hypothetical protein
MGNGYSFKVPIKSNSRETPERPSELQCAPIHAVAPHEIHTKGTDAAITVIAVSFITLDGTDLAHRLTPPALNLAP